MAEVARFLSTSGKVHNGVKRVVRVPAPAAGAEFSVAVPGGAQWRILAGMASLTTSAVVANRLPRYAFTIAGLRVYETGDAVNYAAGGTYGQSFAIGAAAQFSGGGGNSSSVPIPSLWLPDGAVFGSHTVALDVGDQWSAAVLWIEECYFTDAELTEDREQLRRDLLQAAGALNAAGPAGGLGPGQGA